MGFLKDKRLTKEEESKNRAKTNWRTALKAARRSSGGDSVEGGGGSSSSSSK